MACFFQPFPTALGVSPYRARPMRFFARGSCGPRHPEGQLFFWKHPTIASDCLSFTQLLNGFFCCCETPGFSLNSCPGINDHAMISQSLKRRVPGLPGPGRTKHKEAAQITAPYQQIPSFWARAHFLMMLNVFFEKQSALPGCGSQSLNPWRQRPDWGVCDWTRTWRRSISTALRCTKKFQHHLAPCRRSEKKWHRWARNSQPRIVELVCLDRLSTGCGRSYYTA